MQSTAMRNLEYGDKCTVTLHGRERMSQRRISEQEVQVVIDCGRELHLRGAVVYAVGRREVERYQRVGLDLSGCDGLQVVCDKAGTVITTYRNRDFSGLRSRRRPGRAQGRTH